MEKKTMEQGVNWLIMGLGVLVLAIASVSCVDDKCLACQLVAEELELGLANERPRNHLDMRHRLDSKGQREGKLINYKVSELRVVELLEGLCNKLKEHTFVEGSEGQKGQWLKVKSDDLSGIERQRADVHSKDLTSYCGRLLEATEEELAQKLQKGELMTGEVEKVLCSELSRHCKQSKRQDGGLDKEISSDISGRHWEL